MDSKWQVDNRARTPLIRMLSTKGFETGVWWVLRVVVSFIERWGLGGETGKGRGVREEGRGKDEVQYFADFCCG